VNRLSLVTGPWADAQPSHEIVQWGSITITESLDNAANGTVRVMSLAHPTTPPPTIASHDLWCYDSSGVLVFRGRMLASPLDVSPDSAKIDYNLLDYRGLLDRRLFMSQVSFADTEQIDIAWAMIAHTQGQVGGNLGITRGTAPASGQLRDRNYDPGDGIGQRLQELSNVINGFQYEIDPQKRFNTWYPERRRVADYVLACPGSVDEANVESGLDRFANAIVATGDNSVLAPQVRVDGTSVGGPEGRWEAGFNYPDVSNAATLSEHADGRLAAVKDLQRLFTLTVAPQLSYDPQFRPKPGDQVPCSVRWPGGGIECDVYVTSVEWFVEPHGAVRCTLSAVEVTA